MKNIRFTFLMTPIIFMALLFISGCIGLPSNVYHIKDTQIESTVKQLAIEKKEYFNNPFTFMIIVDSSPCVKSLGETQWWAEWQKHLLEGGVGFVFATSRADSVDVVVAAELDNVKAPVLVLPLCDKYVSELGVPFGGLPLKILVDSGASVLLAKAYVSDSNESNRLMSKIDSLVNMKITNPEN